MVYRSLESFNMASLSNYHTFDITSTTSGPWNIEDYEEMKADVFLVLQPSGERILVRDLRVQVNSKHEIDFSDLIESLLFMQYPLKGKEIGFYSEKRAGLVLCGREPISANKKVPVKEFPRNNGRLQIKLLAKESERFIAPVKQIPITVADIIADITKSTETPVSVTPKPLDLQPVKEKIDLEEEMTDIGAEESQETLSELQASKSIDVNARRTKEKKIKDVLAFVTRWRQLHQGFIDENGQDSKLSLEDAAIKIGMSKKSLDDYLLQIRAGEKFGFDFKAHMNDGVGILRAFVKKCKTAKNKPAANKLHESNFPKEFDLLLRKKEAKSLSKELSYEPEAVPLSTRSKKIRK